MDRRVLAASRIATLVGDFDRATPYEAELSALLAPGIADGTMSWLRGAGAVDVSRAMHAADVAALPFHSGAASNRSTLLTALEHGLPTVTTRGPATPADFADHFPVRLVPTRDPGALAAALEAALDAPQAADPARRSVAVLPDWEEIAARHVELYEGLAGAERAAV